MKQHRTTVTLPFDVYRDVKVRAARQNKSVSRFIRDLLQNQQPARKNNPRLPFGKYNKRDKGTFPRKKMYDTYLRKKISS